MGEILNKIENGISVIQKMDAGKFRLSRIEFGADTYKEFNAEANITHNIKDLGVSVTHYKGIPIKENDYFTGIYFKLEIL